MSQKAYRNIFLDEFVLSNYMSDRTLRATVPSKEISINFVLSRTLYYSISVSQAAWMKLVAFARSFKQPRLLPYQVVESTPFCNDELLLGPPRPRDRADQHFVSTYRILHDILDFRDYLGV